MSLSLQAMKHHLAFDMEEVISYLRTPLLSGVGVSKTIYVEKYVLFESSKYQSKKRSFQFPKAYCINL